jgi:hypothetical protein
VDVCAPLLKHNEAAADDTVIVGFAFTVTVVVLLHPLLLV